MSASAELFARALVEVEEALDWDLLGDVYCHEGGERFFPPEQRAAIREAGLRVASDLGGALAELGGGGVRRSLYVGAGVAELVPMLCEALVLGRSVRARTLAGPELDELNRALASVEAEVGCALPRLEATPVGEDDEPWDHLWLVSVLSDPEAFPALSAVVYGRARPAAGALAADRERARALVEAALRGARTPAVVTTTDEELPFLEDALSARGKKLRVPPRGRLSAIVGDPIRHAFLA